MSEALDEYRIGRARAIRTLWREYARLARQVRRVGFTSYLTNDAQIVKAELDRLLAEERNDLRDGE